MKFKVISIAKFLSKKYGGKWKYQYPCYWYCDDNNRYVARVCVDFYNDGESRHPGSLCLYYENNSKPPEWV